MDSDQKNCPPQNNRVYIRNYNRMTREHESVFGFQSRNPSTGRGVVAPEDDDSYNLTLNRSRIHDLGFWFMPKEWTFIHLETRKTWCAIRLPVYGNPRFTDVYGATVQPTSTVLVLRDVLVADEEVHPPVHGSGQQRPPLNWLPLTGKEVRLVGQRRGEILGLRAHTAPDPISLYQDQAEVRLSLMDQCILQWMFSEGPGVETFARTCLDDQSVAPQFVAHDGNANSSLGEPETYRTNKDHVKCVVEKHLPLYGPFYADPVTLETKYVEFAEPWTNAGGEMVSPEELADKYCIWDYKWALSLIVFTLRHLF